MIQRRGLLLGSIAAATPRLARPARPVSLLVGARAGSPADQVARAFIPFLARQLPLSEIEIHNVDGDAGLSGFRALAGAPPTGAVLGWIATPTLPARMVDRGGDELMQRILLLGAVQKEPIAIVSAAATPMVSVQDLIGRSAEDSDAVPLGTPPPGSPPHLAALRLQAIAGVRLNIVAFPSAAAARQAAIAGNVAAASLGLANAIGELRAGRLAGLGIAAQNRSESFPDMPPLHDAGLDLKAFICRGLAAPVGLAHDIAAELQAAMQAVVADGGFRELADATGFVATWIDGVAWTEMATTQRTDLAQLWSTEPWLQEGGG